MKRSIIMLSLFAFILAGFVTPVWSVEKTIQLKVEGMNCDMCPPAGFLSTLLPAPKD